MKDVINDEISKVMESLSDEDKKNIAALAVGWSKTAGECFERGFKKGTKCTIIAGIGGALVGLGVYFRDDIKRGFIKVKEKFSSNKCKEEVDDNVIDI